MKRLFQDVYFFSNATVLTIFVIEGGNKGFAALWIILIPFVSMSLVDLRRGFLVCVYFLLMLILVLSGPLSFLLKYNYDDMFRLRFPFLFIVSFALALFIVIRSRRYQYELILGRQKLEVFSTTDMNTGLMNRNKFDQYRKSFVPRPDDTLSAIFIDVNGLHTVNNLQGHDAGDRMLKTIAQETLMSFPTELVYRMGGDEILVLVYNHSLDDLTHTMEKMSSDLEAIHYSISFGIVEEKGTTDIMHLVGEADKKMLTYKETYYKKRNMEHR